MDALKSKTKQKGKHASSLNDIQLRELAGRIGKEWEKLAIYLKFRTDEIERLKSDHQWEEDRIFQLLVNWRHRQSSNAKDTLSNLRKALKKAGRNDLASDLGKPEFDVETCQEELITYYKSSCGLIQLVPWDDETEDMDAMFVNLELTHETTKRSHNQSGRILSENHELFTLKNWEDKRVNRVLVSGGPGSGKSTLFAKLAYDWAQQIPDTPLSRFALVFLIEFREMVKDKNPTFVGAIFDQLLPMQSKVDRKGLEQYIRNNQLSCLILLDGFDERSSGPIDRNPSNEIDGILVYRDFRECFLLVSSRPHKIYNLGSAGKMYTQVALTGFSEENVNTYIHKYFSRDEESADALVSEISKSKNLLKFSRIPYMLILLCLIWSEDRNLPETQTKLYQQAMFYMWKRYCFKKPTHIDYSENEIQAQLDRLLIALGQTVYNNTADKKEEQILFQQSSFKGDVYEDACAVGILTKEKSCSKLRGSNITFVHKSFQEFSAACHVVHMAVSDNKKFLDFIAAIKSRDDVSKLFQILVFSCGLNTAVADTILNHLAETFRRLSPEVSYVTHGKYGIWPLFVFAQESGIPYNTLHDIFKDLFASSILISPESLTDQEWIAFEMFVQKASKSDQQSILNNITAIDCGDFLSSNCIRVLSLVLEKMVPKLQKLALRNSSEDTSECWDREQLAEAITKISMLFDLSIDLSNDVSGRYRYFNVSEFLTKIKSKKLQSLDISDGISNPKKMSFDVTKLATYLADQTLISSLSVANLNLKLGIAACLIQALQNNGNLKRLHFVNTNIQEAVADIGPVICQLESLRMSKCGITDLYMTPFGEYVVNAAKLTELDLSQNDLGDCQTFGTRLCHCKELEKLVISYTCITNDGMEAISQSLPDMHRLKKLDVSHNKHGLTGLQALFKSLHSATNLGSLNCGPCPVPIKESCSVQMSECLAVADIHLPVTRNFHKVILLLTDEQEIISKMLLDRSWENKEENVPDDTTAVSSENTDSTDDDTKEEQINRISTRAKDQPDCTNKQNGNHDNSDDGMEHTTEQQAAISVKSKNAGGRKKRRSRKKCAIS